jgi:auxin efflux carrier family protein
MTNATASVILAAAQSVGKVYVIGAVGFWAVTCKLFPAISPSYISMSFSSHSSFMTPQQLVPRKAPLLPVTSIGALARFSFNILTISLIYGTIARTVSTATIGTYWFVMVGDLVVATTSYVTATLLGLVIKVQNPTDFNCLRIAASFPNVVALPILIFPSLCEYPVVYEAFGGSFPTCVDQSTTLIFLYFFSWSFLFWTFGHRQLMAAANQRLQESTLAAAAAAAGQTTEHTTTTELSNPDDQQHTSEPDVDGHEIQNADETLSHKATTRHAFWDATRKSIATTFLSPGFVAMLLGFITACIPPLQQALFSQGGALRFLGGAIDTMGTASSSISTIVVAASLVPNKIVAEEQEVSEDTAAQGADDPDTTLESPIMSDPNFGPRQRRASSIRNVTLVVRRRSSLMLNRIRRSDRDMMRIHVWFNASRLIITPAIISGGMAALDCAGALRGIPNLTKLVIVINSALPGALIVVVLLKSQPSLSESASVVARVYLPSYIISIVTIAAWASVGLYISVPREDGTSFCGM